MMWNNNDHQISILPPGKGFYTPSPASSSDFRASQYSNSPAPMSEPRRRSLANGGDLFHVIHKVPAGNSPYVRAKQVQLIEKDPSRSISLFWSAINAGDRVDSALKDMAIVMKQLNRSDEAIEAIKSFRHLCPHDSQESLDNVLVELYKRAGRVEEEIEMLLNKLKQIEEGLAFGGRRTKTARSQGKKVHITMDEERSRILGNLAWAYLQQNNYGAAEEYYRRALAFEPDKNKECNLAICLMHMNRLAEAKSLLRAVKASCGRNLMDESFAKSYERACEILTDFEARSASEPSVNDRDWNLQQRGEFYRGINFETEIPVVQEICSPCAPYRRGGSFRNGGFDKTLGERRSGFNGGRMIATEPQSMSWRRNTHWRSETRAPLTQPRRCLWGFRDGDMKKSTPEERNSEPLKSQISTETPKPSVDSSSCRQKKSWADMAEEEEDEEFFKESPRLQTQMKINGKNENQNFGFYSNWNAEEEFNDENFNVNVVPESQMKGVVRKLELFNVRDKVPPEKCDASPRDQPVKRSLCFDHNRNSVNCDASQGKGKSITLLRRNRLKVFEEITRSP